MIVAGFVDLPMLDSILRWMLLLALFAAGVIILGPLRSRPLA